MVYIVTAPLVLVNDSEGRVHHIYEGSQLPKFASDDFISRMLADKLIVDVSSETSTK